ncbi:unnamed protein product [Mycena citricolor]|uniref:Uncharacterized protein n=1 Tax=Mycena citricolor TaxID=2018698 RepID=A0AAD2H9U1_9AGAR|nr:unnamed protein product [Mycena citricolor]
MVSQNPLFYGGWSIKKFNATVINDIWPETMFFTLVATMVALITKMKIYNLSVNSSLLTVLGTVLGLVISFRTSSAYERYQEGRKMWTNIQIASRNIAQIIWIHVPTDRVDKDKNQLTTVQSIIEKKSMINLVQGFSVSVKHFLRGETGIYYEDLFPLICILPRYASSGSGATAVPPTDADMLPLWAASEDEEHCPLRDAPPPSRSTTRSGTAAVSIASEHKSRSWFGSSRKTTPFDPEKALADVQAHRELKPARNPPPLSFFDFFPFLRIFAVFTKCFSRRSRKGKAQVDAKGRKIKPALAESNVPLEITIYLNNYLAYLLRNGWLQPAFATGMMNNVASLQDTLSNLDRIGSTPLPFAYQAHLRMSLWLYLLLLPFQVVGPLGYLVIPGTAFASFLLLGFLEIGQEIENPFNYDLNDLDLDSFCLAIQRELHEVTAHTTPDPQTFLFSSWNQPFAPADRRSAEELVALQPDYVHTAHPDSEPGMATIRRTLLKNWRDVDRMTREY